MTHGRTSTSPAVSLPAATCSSSRREKGDAMPDVTIKIPQDYYGDLIATFGSTGVLGDPDLAKLVTLALTQWTTFLLGKRRFRSITELYIDWFGRVFEDILPDEEPDERALVERMNLPYGQAAYIARVLRERDASKSRSKWL